MGAPRLTTSLRVTWRVHRFLLRISGGRVGRRVGGMDVLELTTVGRRTGEPRTVALYTVEDGGRAVDAASHVGAARHPVWWLTLRSNPAAVVRRHGRRTSVRARVAEGDERQRLWAALVAANPDYAEYAERTTRRIPVVVLEPA
jgi:deazaflavin-dependent oxidoreductase (nitroreductase family)